MNEKTIFILFVFFVFIVFLLNNFGISGRSVIDVSHRFCIDSDNGISPYTAGFVVSDIGTFNDRCFDNLNQIREYFCIEGRDGRIYKVSSKVVSCGMMYKCVMDVDDGADVCMMGSFNN